MIKKYIKYIALILGCALTVGITAVLYYQFTQRHIYQESKSHLTEIYNQTNAIFGSKIETNRQLLASMDKDIEAFARQLNADGADVDAVKADINAYMDKFGKMWGFKDFYFIGQTGVSNPADPAVKYTDTVNCKSYKGDEFTLRIHRKLEDYLKDEKGGGLIAIREGETAKHMLFAVAVKTPDSFLGFEYSAIGFSIDEEEVVSILRLAAYDGNGQFCIARANGDVMMKTDPSHKVTNVFEHFVIDNVTITNSTIDDVKRDWGGNTQPVDTIVIEENSRTFYWSYRPIGFDGWMLVGIISTDIVNSNMNQFGTATACAMAIIFLAISSAVIILFVSMTKQRARDRSLKATLRENLLDNLSLNSNDLFIIFSGTSFKADYVSSNITRVLGLDAEATRADMHEILKACPVGTQPFTTEGLKRLPVGTSWGVDMKMKHIDEDKSYFYYMILTHCIVNGDDMFIMTLSDRTADKAMQEKLVDALNIAKNANNAKSNFLSNMSHDIRTPMNAIIGYSTLLAKECSNPERVRDYTKKITYSGHHLLGIINDILDMSKIESGKTSLNLEEFNLPEFINELYSIMEPQASAKKIKFNISTHGDIPECVLGDKMRLNRVILNILSNAVKYTPSGGSVDFRVDVLEQAVHNHTHLKFTVADTGIGMSKEYIKSIFEPFSRDNTASAKAEQGTGLGMAIAKNIVDLMGGVIFVESTLGKGSTFTVELELAIADQEPEDEQFWQNHNIGRALVVDDSEDICIDVKEHMADTGVEINYELSGEKAIEDVKVAIESKKPLDMILLDWKMPGMNGLETAKHIRKIVGKQLPIIILTAYSFSDISEEAQDVGIDAFMAKPFSVANLKRAVMQIKGNDKPAEEEKREGEFSLNGLKVLVAEDNALNAELLEELLDIEGVSCDIKVDGKKVVEAFEAAPADKYDMIFMDIQMPIMNGYEAARAIRSSKHKNAKTIPIIAMTANAFDTDVKEALDAGMNAHIAKPVDIPKLKQIIEKLEKRK